MGYDVVLAKNGLEAVEKIQKENIALALMDIQMPEMDGLQATQSIRKLDSPKSKIPIVALTANAYEKDRRDCFEAGMNDFLVKPIKKEDLQKILDKYLSSSTPQT